MYKHSDEFYIKRCLQIAKNGRVVAMPNPSVGAVIVYQSKIIGEGYTSSFGCNHAEINALHAVKNKSLLKDATLYVTLEPCAHFGKTPPCANAIVASNIKKVVIGCLDPNPKVAGKGVQILKDANIDVTVGVLEADCKKNHQKFLLTQQQKRPYITLKWAQSLDGFIAPKKQEKGKPFWITNVFSRQLSHQLRVENQAILVGTNTVLKDNPSLTARDWFGKNPTRIVIDKNLKLDKNFKVFDNQSNTIVFAEESSKKNEHDSRDIQIKYIQFSNNLASQICEVLYANSIQSLVIEGGLQTLQTFIDANLWDKAFVFSSNLLLHQGLQAPKIIGTIEEKINLHNDDLTIYRNDKNGVI